ncbi:hypothetical protein ACHAPJ_008302 [Fusarium lateritium]
MQTKTIFAASLLGGLAAAAPWHGSPKPKVPKPFELLAVGCDPIQFAGFNAAKSSLFLELPQQGATCDTQADSFATFRLTKETELYLYSTENPPQKIYVDRSGMGQGKVGYVTGAEPPPKNAETKGWKIDESGNLTLDGAGFIACPHSIEGAWSVWVSAGVANPGGNKKCLGFSAQVSEATDPKSCLYTS